MGDAVINDDCNDGAQDLTRTELAGIVAGVILGVAIGGGIVSRVEWVRPGGSARSSCTETGSV